jgi:hypothetical protein
MSNDMQRGGSGSNERQGSTSSRSAPKIDSTIPAPKAKYGEVFEEDEQLQTPRPSFPTPQTPLAPPKIMTTLPSPATGTDPHLDSPLDVNGTSKHKPQRRASFHPPPLDTAFSREVLLTSRTGALPGAAGMTVEDDEGPDAIMNSVEDMLESFDWTVTNGNSNGAIDNGRKKGSADAIESRLLDELSALDSVSSASSLTRHQLKFRQTFTPFLNLMIVYLRSWDILTKHFWNLTISTCKSPATRCSST